MKVDSVFLARYVEAQGGLLYISGAFPEWWQTPAFGTLQQIAFVLVTRLEPSELGETFEFEILLRRPDETEWPIAQVRARRPPIPGQDVDLPQYYNLVFGGIPVDFRQEGRHRFSIKHVGDEVAAVWLYVQLAPPQTPVPAPSQDLTIEEANYGMGGHWVDVTEALQSSIIDNRLEVDVSNEFFGSDPAPGVKKALRVRYRLGGGPARNIEFPENTKVILPLA